MIVARVFTVKSAQQARPGQAGTGIVGHCLELLADVVDHALRQGAQCMPATLRHDLDFAGTVENVHLEERIRAVFANGQQAVVAQNHVGCTSQILDQPGFFFGVQSHALIVMVRQGAQRKQTGLGQGEQAGLLGTDSDPGIGVQVHDHMGIIAGLVHGTVYRKAGRVDVIRRVRHLVACQINLDQTAGRDFAECHAVGIDQKMGILTRHARGNVREDQIIPTIERHQPVAGGEIDALLPFLMANRVLHRQSIHNEGLCIVPVLHTN